MRRFTSARTLPVAISRAASPQLIVQRIRRCEVGEFNEADFCPASVRDPEEMLAELRGFVESIVDANLRIQKLVQPSGPLSPWLRITARSS